MIHDDRSPPPDPLRFPVPADVPADEGESQPMLRLVDDEAAPQPAGPDVDEQPGDDVLARVANVSRRIHDLARELGCPNHLNDDDRHRPRAA